MEWLNLPMRGDLVDPHEWEEYGVSPPPQVIHAEVLSDGEDTTGITCYTWDRSQVNGHGCAARVLVPERIDLLTAIRAHGRVNALFLIEGTDPKLYCRIEKGIAPDNTLIAELSVDLTATEVPYEIDFGWITGLSIAGDEVNSLYVYLSCEATDADPYDATLMLSELLFDYVGNPAGGKEIVLPIEETSTFNTPITEATTFDAEASYVKETTTFEED